MGRAPDSRTWPGFVFRGRAQSGFVLPREVSADLRRYIFKRKDLMQQIEQRDIQELEKNPP